MFSFSETRNFNISIVDIVFKLIASAIEFDILECHLEILANSKILQPQNIDKFKSFCPIISYFTFDAEFHLAMYQHMVHPTFSTMHDLTMHTS